MGRDGGSERWSPPGAVEEGRGGSWGRGPGASRTLGMGTSLCCQTRSRVPMPHHPSTSGGAISCPLPALPGLGNSPQQVQLCPMLKGHQAGKMSPGPCRGVLPLQHPLQGRVLLSTPGTERVQAPGEHPQAEGFQWGSWT